MQQPIDYRTLAVKGVQALQPYQPGKPESELRREYGLSDIVKLASNENPLGPSPRALVAVREALSDMARYPDGNGFELKTALAAKLGVSTAMLTLGNGSNDVLELAARAFLTPEYSYSLAQNFRPLPDYEANIKAAMQPVTVLAGTADEAFYTDKLQETFRKQGKNWTVTLLPGIGHIPLTLEPSAVNAAVKAVSDMRTNGG